MNAGWTCVEAAAALGEPLHGVAARVALLFRDGYLVPVSHLHHVDHPEGDLMHPPPHTWEGEARFLPAASTEADLTYSFL